jgi:competence protein ComEC
MITNIWAIPAVGFLIGFGGVSLLVSLVIPPLGGWFLMGAGSVADLFVTSLIPTSNWPLIWEVYPTAIEVWVIYGMIGLIALILIRPSTRPYSLLGLLLLLAILILPGPRRRGLEVTFLDVGQGDCTLIRTPAGETILIDGGGFLIPGKPPPFDVGEKVVVPYLKREGVRKIDLMILSHPHPDHYGGLRAVAESFPVNAFWWNGQNFPDPTFDRLLTLLQEKGTRRHLVLAPFSNQIGGVKLEIVYPNEINPKRGINDNCLVLQMTYGKTSFLFTGDIERKAEEVIVDLPQALQANVLKIPHHGSKTSSSVPFIEKVSPQYAVVSLDENNWFNLPHPGTLEKYQRRGITLFRTDRHGAVTFYSDGETVHARPYLLPRFSQE